MPILQLVGRSANDCLHSDGKVLELLLGLTPVRTINHLVQARVHDGSLFIFLKDPQDQRPHNAHWAHPSGTRESWSWKMMSSWHKVKVTPEKGLNQIKVTPEKVLNQVKVTLQKA